VEHVATVIVAGGSQIADGVWPMVAVAVGAMSVLVVVAARVARTVLFALLLSRRERSCAHRGGQVQAAGAGDA